MKQFLLGIVLAGLGWMTYNMLMSFDSEARAILVTVAVVLVCITPGVAMLAFSAGKRADRRQDDDDDDDYRATPRRYPEPLPYQPPVIVLAAPLEQKPQVVNTYNDNRQFAVYPAAGGMPLVADQQRQVEQQRRFKVVGEMEEWE
jgi:hypothetical protein